MATSVNWKNMMMSAGASKALVRYTTIRPLITDGPAENLVSL
jgi:hypothetical protein